jgi:thioredoxin 1
MNRSQIVRNEKFLVAFAAIVLASLFLQIGQAQENIANDFPPLDQWKQAVVAGDAAALKALYSTDPATEVQANKVSGDSTSDINFWLGLKAQSITLEIVRFRQRGERASVYFNARIHSGTRDLVVADSTGWLNQGGQWRIAAVERTDNPQLPQPTHMKTDIYPADVDARAEIRQTEERAAKEHKRIILVFGANWCYDCHVLDLAFHRPDFASVMSGYEVVNVNIGDDGKKNNDLADQFGVPLNKGVPALAVIDSTGKVVVSQKNGEFENARGLTPEILMAFLNKWKP